MAKKTTSQPTSTVEFTVNSSDELIQQILIEEVHFSNDNFSLEIYNTYFKFTLGELVIFTDDIVDNYTGDLISLFKKTLYEYRCHIDYINFNEDKFIELFNSLKDTYVHSNI